MVSMPTSTTAQIKSRFHAKHQQRRRTPSYLAGGHEVYLRFLEYYS